MRDFSEISQVVVTASVKEVNLLLEDYWRLLDVYHDNEGTLLFVVGDAQARGIREFISLHTPEK